MASFVAGATGYVGKAIIAELARLDLDPVAHVRPDSSRLPEHTAFFENLGARVDTTAWTDEAMAHTFAMLKPNLVFGCIGTTAARKKVSSAPDAETYEAVDYGLTAILIRAASALPTPPRFVYLSSAGTGPNSPSAYIAARWKVETELRESGLPFTIVRPAIISGADREDTRPGERFGAVVGDAVLGLAGAIGLGKVRDRWSSITATELARAMVDLALKEGGHNQVIDASKLR